MQMLSQRTQNEAADLRRAFDEACDIVIEAQDIEDPLARELACGKGLQLLNRAIPRDKDRAAHIYQTLLTAYSKAAS
jgi:hypothetical protein